MAKLYKPSKGISVGLVWFLLYLFVFFVFGYGLLFSMVLGMIGGIVTGSVANWWTSSDEVIAKPSPVSSEEDDYSLPNQPVKTLRRQTKQTALRRHANREKTNIPGLPQLRIPFQKNR